MMVAVKLQEKINKQRLEMAKRQREQEMIVDKIIDVLRIEGMSYSGAMAILNIAENKLRYQCRLEVKK